MNEQKKAILKTFIPLAAGLSFIFLFIYTSSQQVVRLGANALPAQIALDSAATLARGEEPAFLKSNVYGKVDINKSLAPFLISFDGAGAPIVSTALLGGSIPLPPQGVFADARKHGQDRITWQPRKGVRIAAVVVYYKDGREGFALSGRSLREAESLIDSLCKLLGAGWLVSLFGAFAYAFILNRKKGTKPLENRAIPPNTPF